MKEFTVLVDEIPRQGYRVKAVNKEKAIKKAMSSWYEKIAHPSIVDIFETKEVDKMSEEEKTEEAPEEENKEDGD